MLQPSAFISDETAGKLGDAIWQVANQDWPQPDGSPSRRSALEKIRPELEVLGATGAWWSRGASKELDQEVKAIPFDQAVVLAMGLRYSRPGVEPYALTVLSTRRDLRDPAQFRKVYLESAGLRMLGGRWEGTEYVHRGVRYPAQTVNDLEHFFLSAETTVKGLGHWDAKARAWLWNVGVEGLLHGGKSDRRQYEGYDRKGIAFAAAHGY